MKNTPFLIGAAVVLAICFAIVSRAGDLNPPDGPVAPSMHTIDDLYSLMGQQNPNRPWQSKVIEVRLQTPNAEQIIFPEGTSGVVHAMHFVSIYQFDCLEMEPNALPLFSVEVNNNAIFISLPLDVQFTNGLRMRLRNGSILNFPVSITIFYREDSIVSPPRP